MKPHGGNDLDRFVTTYNSDFSWQSTNYDGTGIFCTNYDGAKIFCTLSVDLVAKEKSSKNEIVGRKTPMREGKIRRRGDVGQGWKVTKGARGPVIRGKCMLSSKA